MDNHTYPFVSVKDALHCFKKEVICIRTHKNLEKCIQSFKLSMDDNIIPLLYMIIHNPLAFKDPENYPRTWKVPCTRASGVSAINKCMNVSVCSDALGKEQVDMLRTALSQYINELKGVVVAESTQSSDTPSIVDPNETHDDTEGNTQDDYVVDIVRELKKEIKLLKLKENTYKTLLAAYVAKEDNIEQKWMDALSNAFDNLLV